MKRNKPIKHPEGRGAWSTLRRRRRRSYRGYPQAMLIKNKPTVRSTTAVTAGHTTKASAASSQQGKLTQAKLSELLQKGQ